MQSQKQQNDLCFQGKPFNITVIQDYASTSNVREAKVEWFYEGLQDLLELTHKNGVHFSSLIPEMLMFTLAIFCLTTSNLP